MSQPSPQSARRSGPARDVTGDATGADEGRGDDVAGRSNRDPTGNCERHASLDGEVSVEWRKVGAGLHTGRRVPIR